MDKTTKTILIIIGSILLLCVCATTAVFVTGLWSFGRFVNWAGRNTTENPQEAVRFGSEIADFEIPGGFGSPYGVHFGDVTLVGYKSQSEETHIVLAQFPEGTSINDDEMLRLIKEGTGNPDSIWYDTETALLEQRPVTIRGEKTILNISEGRTSNGTTFRMATATFRGRGGPSLLLVAGPIDEWDMEMIEEFISLIN